MDWCAFLCKCLYAINEIQTISSNEKLKSKEARVNSRKKKWKWSEMWTLPPR